MDFLPGFNWLNNYFSSLGFHGFTADLLVAGALTLVIMVSVIIVGFFVDLIDTVVFSLFKRLLGLKGAIIICRYLTFPGIMLHELAHALFIIITGGRIKSICLLSRLKEGGVGQVQFWAVGSRRRQAVQLALSSCAPVLMGFIEETILLILLLYFKIPFPFSIMLWYMVFTIGVHMSMSREDLKCYLKGWMYILPVMFLFILFVQYLVYDYRILSIISSGLAGH